MSIAHQDPEITLTAALEHHGCGPPERGGMWRCPAHDDRTPSLHVARGDSGMVLTCHAGCDRDAVIAALGLTWPDLMHDRRSTPDASEATTTDRYTYRALDGTELYRVVIRRGQGGKRVHQERRTEGGWTAGLDGMATTVYRLPELAAALASGPVPVLVIAEGERDVDRLWREGIPSTTNSGGAGKWKGHHTRALLDAVQQAGREPGRVVIVADRDAPGVQHAHQVASSLGCVCSIPVAIVQSVTTGAGHDVSDHLDAGHGFDALVPLTGAGPDASVVDIATGLPAEPRREEEPDEEPDEAEPMAPPVPLDLSLLGPLGEWADSLATSLQVAPSLAGWALLHPLSVCAQRRLRVEVRPGWMEELSWMMVLIARSGERKTPLLAAVTAPLIAIQAEEEDDWRIECADMEPAERPPMPGIYVSGTPEVIWRRWGQWGERCAVLTDEPRALHSMSGEYGGSPVAAMEPYLLGYSGAAGARDRVTGNERISVERACLSLLTGCQPAVLDRIAESMAGGMDAGIWSRLTLVDAVSMVGQRVIAPPPWPDSHREGFEALVRALWAECRSASGRLTLTPAAHDALTAYEAAVERDLGPGRPFESAGLVELASKIVGRAVRYAALLHLAWRVLRSRSIMHAPIGLTAIDAGIALAEVEMANAERLYARLRRHIPLDQTYGTEDRPDTSPPALDRVLPWLAARPMGTDSGGSPTPGATATQRDVYHHFRWQSWCRTVDDMAAVLDWAEDHGLTERIATGGFGRTRSVTWQATATGRAWVVARGTAP